MKVFLRPSLSEAMKSVIFNSLKLKTFYKETNHILNINFNRKLSTKSIYDPLTKKKEEKNEEKILDIQNYQPKRKLRKIYKNKSISQSLEEHEEKEFQEYVENFAPLESIIHKNEIKLREFIICQEYLYFLHLVFKNNYVNAGKVIEGMRVMLREGFIGSYIYTLILRRAGLCKIWQGKIIEGILDLENVYEFSKNRDFFDYKYRFNAKIELLKTYMNYDPIRCKQFTKIIKNEEYEQKILDMDQLATFNHLVGVSIIIIHTINITFKI
jgi:hypothetical protein